MKSYYKAIFLIIAFMAYMAISHRGGPRPSGSRSSNGRSNFPFGNSQNCKTANGVTTCTYVNKQKQSSAAAVWILAGGLAMFAYAHTLSKNKAKRRQAIIVAAMNQFSTRYLEQSVKVSPKEKSRLIDHFMSKKYTMIVDAKDKQWKQLCRVKVEELKKQNQDNQNKYIVKMTGTDQIGSSHLQGVIMFKSKKLCLKLSKVYYDRRKTGQFRQYDILLYQAEGIPQCLTGTWTFYGHQTAQKCSGKWTMRQIND